MDVWERPTSSANLRHFPGRDAFHSVPKTLSDVAAFVSQCQTAVASKAEKTHVGVT
jgi:hypothetical protein